MVKILGAGLSGLTAAALLAKEGKKAAVHEKAESVGKVVDDVQAIRNYEHDYDILDFFKKEGIVVKHAKPIYKIVKYAPSGKSMTVHSENSKPIFYSVKRGADKSSVEMQMYNKALDNGASVKFDAKEDIKKTDADIVSVGPLYNNIWAFGGVYEVPDIDPETILFFMDNDYCPKGYIYAVPYGKNELTIAATTFDIKCKLPELFSKFTKENKVIKEILDGAKFLRYTSGYSYSNIPISAEINGRRIVGSSAGFLDPSRGFGIKYALWSGILAAKSILDNASYDTLWREAFEKEFLDSMKRRFLLEKMSNEDYEKLILDDEISIQKYDKLPSALRDRLLKMKFSLELRKFRKMYDLSKIFS
jgi:flavin-dependent dehydrogenase